MDKLKVNSSFFSKGGVIGRWNFFINSLLYSFAFFTGALVIGFFLAIAHLPMVVNIFNNFTIGLCYTYFNFINSYKRLRDIRGTTDNELSAQIMLTIGTVVPVVNLFVGLWLLFTVGKITGETANKPKITSMKNAA